MNCRNALLKLLAVMPPVWSLAATAGASSLVDTASIIECAADYIQALQVSVNSNSFKVISRKPS